MILLGYDIGSSSVKASLVEAESGQCIASAFYPKQEAPIISHKAGWAEQNPDDWWEYLRLATAEVLSILNADHPGSASRIAAVGISYQMHGLVCVDRNRLHCSYGNLCRKRKGKHSNRSPICGVTRKL